MRYLPKILGAALLLSAGFVGSGPAAATMPGLLDRSAVTDSPLEKVGYYLPPSSLWLSAILRRLWLPQALLRLWLPAALLWLWIRIWIWASLALLREA